MWSSPAGTDATVDENPADASDAEIAHVRALHDEMVRRYKAADRLQYYKLNQDIHTAIVRLAQNATLADMHQMLQTRLKRIRFIGHEGAEKWAAAVAEHEEMISALEARDAARLSDVVILTSDNPRSEPPEAILEDIRRGIPASRAQDTLVIPDRRDAIARALEMGREGVVVVIAGKGHETYQVLRERTVPFDDRQVARDVLARLAGAGGKR